MNEGVVIQLECINQGFSNSDLENLPLPMDIVEGISRCGWTQSQVKHRNSIACSPLYRLHTWHDSCANRWSRCGGELPNITIWKRSSWELQRWYHWTGSSVAWAPERSNSSTSAPSSLSTAHLTFHFKSPIFPGSYFHRLFFVNLMIRDCPQPISSHLCNSSESTFEKWKFKWYPVICR